MTVTSQAEFARSHGVSKKTVTAWKARGWLVLADGGVDVEASNARLQKYRREGLPVTQEGNDRVTVAAQQGETPAQAAERIVLSIAPHDYDEARRIKENYLALLNQLEYDQKSGAVVAVSDVSGAVGEQFARVRTRLLAIPAEQSPRIHRLKTVAEVQDALQDTITEALEELVGVGASVRG